LEDLRAELTGKGRRERQLERTGGHDDLVGPHCPIAAVELEPSSICVSDLTALFSTSGSL
jgi:hypothetical protein